jgi:hypothetical protein
MYFKDLLEGRAAVSWNAWFKRNETGLSQDLPRADFLRLKFHKLDEAEKLLRQAGVEFSLSAVAKREKYYSLLHDSVLDENGRPTEAFRRKLYNGAIGYFLDGQPEKGKELLATYLRNLNRRPVLKRVEELDALCFDGEMELEYGNQEIGRTMLELVAALPTGDDLLDPAINRARELLGCAKD